VLQVTSRRCAPKEDLLLDHLEAVLSTAFELQMYGLYLQSAPAKVAGLLASEDSVPNAKNEKQKLCRELREEWELVLHLEAATDTAVLKKQRCSYTEQQIYRELMTQLEVHSFQSCPAVEDLIRSWYPPLAFSANCETCFNCLEDDVKRGQKSQGLSLTGLQALAIRSVQHRVLSAENSASKVSLTDEDWEGNEIRGLKPEDFRLDDILKPFPSTSPFHHNRNALTAMSGWMAARRLGVDVTQATGTFWTSSIVQRAMLLHVDNSKWYLCLGSTPNALALKQLTYEFRGTLPPAEVDERNIAADGTCGLPAEDPLAEHQRVCALAVDMDARMPQQLLLELSQVRVFDYTLHFCKGALAAKLDTSCLARRSVEGNSLLVALFQKLGIVKVTVESLSELLAAYKVPLRKNASKSAKVRALMQVPEVKKACSPETLQRVENMLQEMDQRRNKKSMAEAEKEQEDEAAPDEQELLEPEDPAWVAAREMVDAMDREQEEEIQASLRPPDAELASPAEDAQMEAAERETKGDEEPQPAAQRPAAAEGQDQQAPAERSAPADSAATAKKSR
ncbi:unnamed protein product, partial [Symbiodinium necroappetens]